jgi:hypothetical protein
MTSYAGKRFSPFSRSCPPRDVFFNVTVDDVELGPVGWRIVPRLGLVEQVAAKLWGDPRATRFAIVCGTIPSLLAQGVARAQAVATVRAFQEEFCHAVFSLLIERYAAEINPFGLPLTACRFDMDGIYLNENFLGRGIVFHTTKQLHFDIVESLGSNLYGLNENISDGKPIYADALAFCLEHGLSIRDLLVKIPGSRIFSLHESVYGRVLSDYAVVIDVDLDDDMPMTMNVNLIDEAGLMHGAQSPAVVDGDRRAMRPIRHYAFDAEDQASLARWYAAFDHDPDKVAGDPGNPKHLLPPGLEIRPPIRIRQDAVLSSLPA